MLKELAFRHVGPAERFEAELAPRLNLFTGDNGLGKSFLLDVAWWALTGTWAGNPAWPRRGAQARPEIRYTIKDKSDKTATSAFDFSRQAWPRPQKRRGTPSLVVYARVDGGFSVWDPARNLERLEPGDAERPDAYHFTTEALWNGLEVERKVLCNGLIRDWVTWQNQPDQDQAAPFQLLARVIEQLAPHPSEWMKPGKPIRVSIEDVRDIPTLEFPYGTIPVIHASAGVKRILGLAYLLVWAWYEHTHAARLLNQTPTDQLVLLVDEVESHLHPRWQRSILPAILNVSTGLQASVSTQVMATTHAPLILASVEPLFDPDQDRLFLFDLAEQGVTLAPVSWAKQGDTVGWLTSEVFGLKQARSREAEAAIEAAEAFMRGDRQALPQHLQTREQIHQELVRLLPGHDPFWPRWIVSAEAAR